MTLDPNDFALSPVRWSECVWESRYNAGDLNVGSLGLAKSSTRMSYGNKNELNGALGGIRTTLGSLSRNARERNVTALLL